MKIRLRSYNAQVDLEDYFEQVKAFHGSLAPGLVLGGFMVDWALETMAPCEILDAVVETRKCLPDAVQLLTKCSIGNGWLRILDWGILALTLYDKENRVGARVHLDLDKARAFPLVKAWAMKEKPKKENPLVPIIEEMSRAGRQILACQKGIVGTIPDGLSRYDQPKICSRCGEAFRNQETDLCQGCEEPFFKVE